jgi:hydroxymethylpyrimidine pyrophosphatase-like HAD family hydrolase
LGAAATAWRDLGADLPAGALRLILCDVDGVITRGEGQPAELDVLDFLAQTNRRAQRDPCIPALTLCTGRQAPYVELMAQLVETFLPCIFEHGAGLFFPTTFLYEFDPRLGADYAQNLARLRAALHEPLLASGKAFVQPGKEATMTLYPLGGTSLDELETLARDAVARVAPEFGMARNVRGLEVRPHGIDKGTAAARIADILHLPLEACAGVGDSDPDLSFLQRVGFSAAPANATAAVRDSVQHVAARSYGQGLMDIVTLVERRNRRRR